MDSVRTKVLCVDDNDFVAEALRRKFSKEPDIEWGGWLADADELLERAEKIRPHVVLMDIDMPGGDSFEALRRLTERHPDIRVIMFSGHVRAELIDKAVNAGAWGYMSKNEETDAVVSAIRRVMRNEFVIGDDAQAEHRRL